ncbi:MAG: hypothetical protein Q4D51_01950 [Eubacteriales bacterium]|nr:hypothetical protein [Eubacteriales bacterium]
MTTKRSKSSIILAVLVLMVGVFAIIATASQIQKKTEMAPNEIEVDGLITTAGSVETRYSTHIGEDGNEIYDALMYQTIEIEYSVDNKKQTALMNDMLIHHQETETILTKDLEDLYAKESAYVLGNTLKLYVSTDDLSQFRIVESQGSLNIGAAIALIALEAVATAFVLYKLFKHTVSVLFKFC